MNNLKIAVVSLDIAWADVEENLFSTEQILRKLDKDVDVVVLPELFTTGFIDTSEQLRKCAEPWDRSESLVKIKEWSAKYNFAVCGSLLVEENGNFYNRGFFVEPSGESTFYDKKHLFCLSSESKTFKEGTATIPVVRFRGWNISMAVCYELRFPAWLRNTENKYDVLLIPANWPLKRAYAWKQLLIARAIENQAFVVGANRSGKDDGGEYDNLSYIFNYLGKPVYENNAQDYRVIYGFLDKEKLNSYRNSFPVEDDADRFVFCAYKTACE